MVVRQCYVRAELSDVKEAGATKVVGLDKGRDRWLMTKMHGWPKMLHAMLGRSWCRLQACGFF